MSTIPWASSTSNSLLHASHRYRRVCPRAIPRNPWSVSPIDGARPPQVQRRTGTSGTLNAIGGGGAPATTGWRDHARAGCQVHQATAAPVAVSSALSRTAFHASGSRWSTAASAVNPRTGPRPNVGNATEIPTNRRLGGW